MWKILVGHRKKRVFEVKEIKCFRSKARKNQIFKDSQLWSSIIHQFLLIKGNEFSSSSLISIYQKCSHIFWNTGFSILDFQGIYLATVYTETDCVSACSGNVYLKFFVARYILYVAYFSWVSFTIHEDLYIESNASMKWFYSSFCSRILFLSITENWNIKIDVLFKFHERCILWRIEQCMKEPGRKTIIFRKCQNFGFVSIIQIISLHVYREILAVIFASFLY